MFNMTKFERYKYLYFGKKNAGKIESIYILKKKMPVKLKGIIVSF